MPTTQTGNSGPRRKPWRLGLAVLLGALAGATLFPRPAKGRERKGGARVDVRADPAPAKPDSAPRNG